MDGAAIAGVFSRAAASYDTVIPFFAEFGTRLVELARPRPGDRVLDVACGRGATLLPVARAVGPDGTVVGADLSLQMAGLLGAALRTAAVPNASVAGMDVESLGVRGAAFDLVVTAFTLHLVPDPEQAARELFRVLRPGGRIASSAPLGTGPEWQFLGELFRSFAGRATRPLAVPFRGDFDLGAVLRGAGFEHVEIRDEERRFTFTDEEAWWRWSWSHGMRDLLEALPPDALEDMRQTAFDRLRPSKAEGGIPLHQHARFAVATKPGGQAGGVEGARPVSR